MENPLPENEVDDDFRPLALEPRFRRLHRAY
jgi:hypothetical protein